MTDLEVMQRAKTYIDKLANGINPLDDTTIPKDDVINNVRLSRCLFYVSDILRQVIDNGGAVVSKKTKKANFHISFDDIQKFRFSDTPIPVSEIAKRINELSGSENMKNLTYKNITDWLISIEMLRIDTNYDGKTARRPTTQGNELGITTEERENVSGKYIVVLYNRAAQQFIIDNIDSVIAMINQQHKSTEL